MCLPVRSCEVGFIHTVYARRRIPALPYPSSVQLWHRLPSVKDAPLYSSIPEFLQRLVSSSAQPYISHDGLKEVPRGIPTRHFSHRKRHREHPTHSPERTDRTSILSHICSPGLIDSAGTLDTANPRSVSDRHGSTDPVAWHPGVFSGYTSLYARGELEECLDDVNELALTYTPLTQCRRQE